MRKSKDMMRLVGSRIREARKARGMSQAQLGAAVGRAQNLVSRYEIGIVDIGVGDLALYAAALDVSMDYLLGTSPIEQELTLMDEVLDESVRVAARVCAVRCLMIREQIGKMMMDPDLPVSARLRLVLGLPGVYEEMRSGLVERLDLYAEKLRRFYEQYERTIGEELNQPQDIEAEVRKYIDRVLHEVDSARDED